MSKPSFADYALLDSGSGEKLERFGDIILRRPSSVCLWQKRESRLWDLAHAVYAPAKGWAFRGKKFETWQFNVFERKLECRLQSNGQIGFFPEHAFYLPELGEKLAGRERNRAKLKVLNLFAYTGLASVYLAGLGAEVWHVDLSKKALSWAETNRKLNSVAETNLRFICEDSLKFLEREVRRKSHYDVLIVDPPSFSRISKNNFWKLEEVIVDLISSSVNLLRNFGGIICLTCHDPQVDSLMLRNILLDELNPEISKVTARELSIPEEDSPRAMPAGSLCIAERGALL